MFVTFTRILKQIVLGADNPDPPTFPALVTMLLAIDLRRVPDATCS